MTVAAATPLSDAEYHRITREVLDHIEAQLDRWLEEDVVDIDARRSGGLLEMSLPGGSKIIINTQAPLQELWLAARAGGYHFRHIDGCWMDTKSGDEFFALLSTQLSAQAGCALQLPPLNA